MSAVRREFDQCGQGEELFRWGRPQFLEQKTSNFSKFMGGGLSQCGNFAVKSRQFFAILSGRLLWMAPNQTKF